MNNNEKKEIDTPKASVLDWVLTIPFLLSFLCLVIVFDIIQRIAILFGRHPHEVTINWLSNATVYLLKIVGTKITVESYAELSSEQSYLILSNHQSLFDIPILHTVFSSHYPRFIAKQELAKWLPSISFNLRYGGAAVIDRSNAKQAIKEIENLGRLIRKNNLAAIMFPEGTRAKKGQLKQFRYAGFAAMMQAAPLAAIVPVVIDPSWKLTFFNCLPIPRGVHIRIIVGAPIERGEHESLKVLINEIHSIIENTLGRLRGELGRKEDVEEEEKPAEGDAAIES